MKLTREYLGGGIMVRRHGEEELVDVELLGSVEELGDQI